MIDEKLDELLNKISGIFDYAYESSEDKEEKDYICEVENELHDYLREKGLLK